MKKLFVAVLLVISGMQVHAQQEYKYTIDLSNVVDDKVKVVLHCPSLQEKKAEFIMPRAIPGSYS